MGEPYPRVKIAGGKTIKLYHTPSSVAGSVEEFKRRCNLYPGLVELERRSFALGPQRQTPFSNAEMLHFDMYFGDLGGGPDRQKWLLEHIQIPPAYLEGIDQPPNIKKNSPKKRNHPTERTSLLGVYAPLLDD